MGGNFGMSAGPFLVGMWMIKFGPGRGFEVAGAVENR